MKGTKKSAAVVGAAVTHPLPPAARQAGRRPIRMSREETEVRVGEAVRVVMTEKVRVAPSGSCE
jgi:hypothetical protein